MKAAVCYQFNQPLVVEDIEIDSPKEGEVKVKMGTTRLSVDIPWLVALYQENRLKLDELITARYSLEQINEAIEAMQSGSVLRNVILFD